MADYLAFTRPLSPWKCVEGWHLGNNFHDPMHALYLGTLRDLYASALGYWLRQGFYGHGTMQNKLRMFSHELKTQSRQEKFIGGTMWFSKTEFKVVLFISPGTCCCVLELGTTSPQLRIALTFKCFTVANTGLEKTTEYPEMGSCFKAAFMKAACWFFTKMAIQLANAHPHEPSLNLSLFWRGTPG